MKHEDIDHTGLTGVSAGVATDPIFNAAGDLVVGTGSDTAARLAIGTNGYVLTSNGTTAAWAAAAGGAVATDAIWDAAGDLAVGSGANTAAKLAIGTSGYVLTSNGTTAAWAAPSSGGVGFDALTLHGTYGDEFNGTALGGAWTLQGLVAGEVGVADGAAMFVANGATAARSMYQSGPTTDEFDVIATFVHWGVGDVMVGPYIVSSTGTGVAAGIRSSDTSFNVVNLTSYAYASFGKQRTVTRQTFNDEGFRIWMNVSKRGAYYLCRYSFDGSRWTIPLVYKPSTFTEAKIGFGRFHGTVESIIYLERFNVVNDLDVGNNLVTTPTSGTPTYSASSEFSGSYLAGNAANGNPASGEWAANGNTDSPIYWQVSWSVGQTLNRVRLFGRTENFGSGYIEMTDGGTTWRHPLPWTLEASEAMFIDFPTHTGVTSLKVISKAGFGTNPGLNEVEAYYAS